MQVVIVESPAKAKTIGKYLGPDYLVLASMGHVRDLPAKDGSVRPDDDFSIGWELNKKAIKKLDAIIQGARNAEKIVLATDPDREGEAIAWHVVEVLRDKKLLNEQHIERVVFNAMTRSAVISGMQNPRGLSYDLVNSYLARRALDYLVGFTLSPVLWRKLPGSRSAGRVQSVALRLVCEREQEIESFTPQEYWYVAATLVTPDGNELEVHVTSFLGQKLTRLDIKTEQEAERIKATLGHAEFRVSNVVSKPHRRNPLPPFTTSTLQQAASSELGFSAHKTMKIAQKLYEGVDLNDGEITGLITYMRTDSVEITPEVIHEIRGVVKTRLGEQFLPSSPRRYETKAKNAQEAHEAIRPTNVTKEPETIKSILDPEHAKLYELVWKRSVASQMASAVSERTTVEVDAIVENKTVCTLRATGSIPSFEGFLILYPRVDSGETDTKKLPEITSGDNLALRKITTDQSFTEPPPRYTEATLVKKMEEIGIGRPSTYASTLQVLHDRAYVRLDKRRLIPEDRGRIVTAFLIGFFQRYVEYDFTAKLEDDLDKISAGKLAWKDLLKAFWSNFLKDVEKIKTLRTSETITYIDEQLSTYLYPEVENEPCQRECPSCGKRLSLKLGKFGSFIGCSGYPSCRYTKQINELTNRSTDNVANTQQILGAHHDGSTVSLRVGKFGPYVQLDGKEQFKRTAIPKDWNVVNITLEKALALLSLPRMIGNHPESGKPITASIGRFGPFITHSGIHSRLCSTDAVFEIDVAQAVTLLARKEKKLPKDATTTSKDVGEHPTLGGMISIQINKRAAYIIHKQTKAVIPKSINPHSLTTNEAILILKNEEQRLTKPTRNKTKPAKFPSTKRKTASKTN